MDVGLIETVDNPRSVSALASLALNNIALEFPQLTELSITPGSPSGAVWAPHFH